MIYIQTNYNQTNVEMIVPYHDKEEISLDCFFVDIECHRHPCQNGGICTDDQESGHTCHCPLGFTGYNCENGTLST